MKRSKIWLFYPKILKEIKLDFDHSQSSQHTNFLRRNFFLFSSTKLAPSGNHCGNSWIRHSIWKFYNHRCPFSTTKQKFWSKIWTQKSATLTLTLFRWQILSPWKWCAVSWCREYSISHSNHFQIVWLC